MQRIMLEISGLDASELRELREVHGITDDRALFAIDWRTLPKWTPEARENAVVSMHDYALSQLDACDVLQAIASDDRRLGVWLSCACARSVLEHVYADEHGPRTAIETAERWVRGEATKSECREAANAACAVYYESLVRAGAAVHGSDVFRAARRAGSAAFAAYMAAAAASANSAADAPLLVSAASPAPNAARSAAGVEGGPSLRKLCQTIASAVRGAIDAAAEGYARESKVRQHIQETKS